MDELQPLAALVSRQAADLEVYAGFLFAALDGALPPDLLVVQRKSSLAGKLRGKQGEVVGVSVRLGERRFALRRTQVGSPTRASIAHEVGGIVLSTNEVALGEWSQALTQALHQLAQHNSGAATALQRLSSFTV
jgi:hypothetical protein